MSTVPGPLSVVGIAGNERWLPLNKSGIAHRETLGVKPTARDRGGRHKGKDLARRALRRQLDTDVLAKTGGRQAVAVILIAERGERRQVVRLRIGREMEVIGGRGALLAQQLRGKK